MSQGECCICKTDGILIVRLQCKHGICMDCIQGYLNTALGNISMFPVKCPMHYEKCNGIIDATIARRCLSEIQYHRYLEFCDRATYGDGELNITFYTYYLQK